MKALKVGDPMDEATDVGPLAMPQIVDDLEKQVRESVAAGAKLLTGGKRIGERGNFYAPTVLADIPDDAPAYAEEMFGPVASLFRVRDAERGDRASPTPRRSASAPASGRTTAPRRSASSTASRRARSSSTRWSRPIRACRSAA